MNIISKAPAAIIHGETHIPFGLYDGLVRDTSTGLWDRKGGLFKARRTQRKAWIFIGVYSPEIICGIAMADAGFFANAFAYYYSIKDKIFNKHETLVPLGMPNGFEASLDSDWKLKNYRIIQLTAIA